MESTFDSVQARNLFAVCQSELATAVGDLWHYNLLIESPIMHRR